MQPQQPRGWRLAAAALACVFTLAHAPLAWPQPAPTAQAEWNGVPRIIVFGDVHGAYDELHGLLREAGVLDEADHWAAGDAHVVSLGDLLDRGPGSRQVMDLLMRLQQEAAAAGGRLHVLAGNHEALNLLGDLRYVDAREFASYQDLEPSPGREPTKEQPPGYLGHRAALALDGKYGRWLLSLPVAIRINDTLFMHGGPGEVLQGLTLPEINLRYRTALVEAVQKGDIAPTQPLLADGGPNWYRGTALCTEATEADVLYPLLQQFNVARVVVGHTVTRNGRVVTRFDGRVVKVDTGMNREAYKGNPAALFIEPTGLTVQYAGENGRGAPLPEGLFVAPKEIEEAEVLSALHGGTVALTSGGARDETNATVTQGNRRINAVFQYREGDALRHEVAAWRLDRLLGLGLVPATIQTRAQGRDGVLQARPRRWATQAQLQGQQVPLAGWCAMEPQVQLLYALDTLTGNDYRTARSVVFDTADWYVFGTSFGDAFRLSSSPPSYLHGKRPVVGPELRRRLLALDEERLTQALGDVLNARERRAILARRNMLLGTRAGEAAATGSD